MYPETRFLCFAIRFIGVAGPVLWNMFVIRYLTTPTFAEHLHSFFEWTRSLAYTGWSPGQLMALSVMFGIGVVFATFIGPIWPLIITWKFASLVAKSDKRLIALRTPPHRTEERRGAVVDFCHHAHSQRRTGGRRS